MAAPTPTVTPMMTFHDEPPSDPEGEDAGEAGAVPCKAAAAGDGGDVTGSWMPA